MTVRQLPSTRPCFRRYFSTAGVPPICNQQIKSCSCRTKNPGHSSPAGDFQLFKHQWWPCVQMIAMWHAKQLRSMEDDLTLWTSSITYLPLGLRSAMKGVLSEAACKLLRHHHRPECAVAHKDQSAV